MIFASLQNYSNSVDKTAFLMYNKFAVIKRTLEEIKLKAKEIIKKAMSADKITQKELAEAIGLKSQQAVGSLLNRENGMRLDCFLKMLDVMGYEVVVRKKLGASEEWKVDQ